MDPRKPELVVPRIDELIKQFKNVLASIKTAKSSHTIVKAEREGVLVIREICLTAPRLQETLIQSSRNRRVAMYRGIIDAEEAPQETKEEEAKNEEEVISNDDGEMGEERREKNEATGEETEKKNGEEESEIVPEETTVVENIEDATNEAESDSNEIYVAPNQAETVIVEPKPRKKKTSKKKAA